MIDRRKTSKNANLACSSIIAWLYAVENSSLVRLADCERSFSNSASSIDFSLPSVCGASLCFFAVVAAGDMLWMEFDQRMLRANKTRHRARNSQSRTSCPLSISNKYIHRKCWWLHYFNLQSLLLFGSYLFSATSAWTLRMLQKYKYSGWCHSFYSFGCSLRFKREDFD